MIYTEPYTVMWHDTDGNRHVRPSQILMYMQETANQHLERHMCNLDRLRDERGLAFLLSRVSIRMLRPLLTHERIDVQTWVCDGQGLAFNRCFRILCGGETVAEAVTVWALMNLADRSLLRNDQFRYPFGGEEPLRADPPLRFRVPHVQDMTLAGERKIVYSDIDYNGHMNNTRYPDMLCDFTPDICRRRVTDVALSYLHEAPFGKTLRVWRKGNADGSEQLFRTVDEDGNTCLEARLLTEPLEP